MERSPKILLTALALTFATACASDTTVPDGSDVEFRQITEDDLDDLQLHFGDSVEDPDCLIWEVSNGTAYEGEKEDGILVMTVNDENIQDSDGFVVCERDRRQLVDVVTPRGGDVVVLSTLGPFVFEGDLDFRGKRRGQILRMLREQLAYSFRRDHLHEGGFWNSDPLITGTTRMNNFSTMGKLAVAALVAGECGSNGIPPQFGDD